MQMRLAPSEPHCTAPPPRTSKSRAGCHSNDHGLPGGLPNSWMRLPRDQSGMRVSRRTGFTGMVSFPLPRLQEGHHIVGEFVLLTSEVVARERGSDLQTAQPSINLRLIRLPNRSARPRSELF